MRATVITLLIVILSVEPTEYVDLVEEPQIKEHPDFESEYIDVYESDYTRTVNAINHDLDLIGWDFSE